MTIGILSCLLLIPLTQVIEIPVNDVQAKDYVDPSTAFLAPEEKNDTSFFEKAAEITKPDQFGESITLGLPQDELQIVLAADKNGVDQVVTWYDAINARYGDIFPVFGLAQGKSVPLLLRPVVKRIIRRSVSDSVLLDWNNDASESWGIKQETGNFYIISPSGLILLHLTGAQSDGKWEQATKILDEYAVKQTKTAAKTSDVE